MTADEEVFAIVPPFTYVPPTLPTVLGEYGRNLAILALWLVVSIVLASAAVRRLRPGIA